MSFNVARRKRAHLKTDIFFPVLALPWLAPSEGSWKRRERRRADSWVWSGRRDRTEGRTWREKEGLFSCKCVRWVISASPNTQPRHLFTKTRWAWFVLHGWSLKKYKTVFHPGPNAWVSFHIPLYKGLWGIQRKRACFSLTEPKTQVRAHRWWMVKDLESKKCSENTQRAPTEPSC